ncbi:2821_t:CDS:10, partial [Entrophospora sp. SA101]
TKKLLNMPTRNLTNITIKKLEDKNLNTYYLIVNNDNQDEAYFCFEKTVKEGTEDVNEPIKIALTGSLDLEKIGLANLEELIFFTSPGNNNDHEISDRQSLREIDLSYSKKLNNLTLTNNSQLTKITCCVCPSLQLHGLTLKNLPKLEELNIAYTGIDSGLESFPKSLKAVYCDGTKLEPQLKGCEEGGKRLAFLGTDEEIVAKKAAKEVPEKVVVLSIEFKGEGNRNEALVDTLKLGNRNNLAPKLFPKKHLDISKKKDYQEGKDYWVTVTAQQKGIIFDCIAKVEKVEGLEERSDKDQVKGFYTSIDVYDLDCKIEVSGNGHIEFINKNNPDEISQTIPLKLEKYKKLKSFSDHLNEKVNELHSLKNFKSSSRTLATYLSLLKALSDYDKEGGVKSENSPLDQVLKLQTSLNLGKVIVDSSHEIYELSVKENPSKGSSEILSKLGTAADVLNLVLDAVEIGMAHNEEERFASEVQLALDAVELTLSIATDGLATIPWMAVDYIVNKLIEDDIQHRQLLQGESKNVVEQFWQYDQDYDIKNFKAFEVGNNNVLPLGLSCPMIKKTTEEIVTKGKVRPENSQAIIKEIDLTNDKEVKITFDSQLIYESHPETLLHKSEQATIDLSNLPKHDNNLLRVILPTALGCRIDYSYAGTDLSASGEELNLIKKIQDESKKIVFRFLYGDKEASFECSIPLPPQADEEHKDYESYKEIFKKNISYEFDCKDSKKVGQILNEIRVKNDKGLFKIDFNNKEGKYLIPLVLDEARFSDGAVGIKNYLEKLNHFAKRYVEVRNHYRIYEKKKAMLVTTQGNDQLYYFFPEKKMVLYQEKKGTEIEKIKDIEQVSIQNFDGKDNVIATHTVLGAILLLEGNQKTLLQITNFKPNIEGIEKTKLQNYKERGE